MSLTLILSDPDSFPILSECGVRAELPGAWVCERLGEAFAAEAVGWMGGLWGRLREIQSLDSDDLTLYV